MSVLVCVIVLGAASLTGCNPPIPLQPCEWMTTPGDTSGRTAILIDVTASVRPAAGGGPDYAAALEDVIGRAVDARDTVVVAPFSGTGADLSWISENDSTDWQKPDDNEENQVDRQAEARDCLADVVRTAQVTSPVAPATDILGPMADAADWLNEGEGTKHLVVATDGLVTTGCASLVRSSFARGQEITAIRKACAAPDVKEIGSAVLAGITTTFVGLGRPAAGQPLPSPADADWLELLWKTLCQAQGGMCQTRTSTTGGAVVGVPAGSGPAHADPPVEFGSSVVTRSLPAAALFETGHAEVLPASMPVLLDLAVLLRTGETVAAKVIGYADPRGDATYNQKLSGWRAAAVAEVLRQNGVPNVVAVGAGATRSCAGRRDIDPGETSDEATECARRVDIVARRA